MADHFAHGVQLFNERKFYDAHEALEDAWRESRGEQRLFLQALTQAAVALHHHSTGNLVGARSVMERSLRNLSEYPARFDGIEVERLRAAQHKFLLDLRAGTLAPVLPQIETVT